MEKRGKALTLFKFLTCNIFLGKNITLAQSRFSGIMSRFYAEEITNAYCLFPSVNWCSFCYKPYHLEESNDFFISSAMLTLICWVQNFSIYLFFV